MIRLAVALVLLSSVPVLAGVDEEWTAIIALDEGPNGNYKSATEVAAGAKNHLTRQENALRSFIQAHPGDARVPQAKVRLADVIVASGAMSPGMLRNAEAVVLLNEVEKDPAASGQEKAAAGFARVSMVMQTTPPVSERERLLEMVREFAKKYPGDKRISRLLVEVATVYDIEPAKKRALLNEALGLNPDAETRARIADDTKRLDLLGLPMRLRASAVDGKVIDIDLMKGRPMIVFFWAGWSQPSIKQLERLIALQSKMPSGSFDVVAISLDKNKKQVASAWKQIGAPWPLICDEKGWESPLVRSVGINALPTTWILDRDGVLRVLNARDDLEDRLRETSAKTN